MNDILRYFCCPDFNMHHYLFFYYQMFQIRDFELNNHNNPWIQVIDKMIKNAGNIMVTDYVTSISHDMKIP